MTLRPLVLLVFALALALGSVPSPQPTNAASLPQVDAPIEILRTWITENSIGTPIANMRIRNTRERSANAIELRICAFNRFNEPVYEYGFGSHCTLGLYQELLPGDLPPSAGRWISYIPALGTVNFSVTDGDVLWVVSPSTLDIAVGSELHYDAEGNPINVFSLQPGGQFVLWRWGAASAEDIFGNVTIAWKFRPPPPTPPTPRNEATIRLTLFGHDTATQITVEVTRVQFVDGSQWP